MGKLIRYPQIATEILTSELWTISETVMSHKDTLLKPFWDAVLPDVPSPAYESEKERARDEFWSDADEERDRKREIIRGMWTRVNGALMHKRTHEVGTRKTRPNGRWFALFNLFPTLFSGSLIKSHPLLSRTCSFESSLPRKPASAG